MGIPAAGSGSVQATQSFHFGGQRLWIGSHGTVQADGRGASVPNMTVLAAPVVIKCNGPLVGLTI